MHTLVSNVQKTAKAAATEANNKKCYNFFATNGINFTFICIDCMCNTRCSANLMKCFSFTRFHFIGGKS